MGILNSLLRKSTSLNKAAILSTFHSSLDNFRKAGLDVQVEVGKKIVRDMISIGEMPHQEVHAKQRQLCQKYKDLRNRAFANGARNDRDPDYAHAAIMESVVLSMEDKDTFQKIGDDVETRLLAINVIERK